MSTIIFINVYINVVLVKRTFKYLVGKVKNFDIQGVEFYRYSTIQIVCRVPVKLYDAVGLTFYDTIINNNL